MSQTHHIRYVLHREIDMGKWDACVREAKNGLIYGYSFYLDHMAKHWEGLVWNDYDAVMPATWNRKFGIHYLYQPPFTANLGVFAKDLNEELITAFIQSIPKRFKLIEISLNHGNMLNQRDTFLMPATNYILSLNKSYTDIYRGYRENHQRNIQRAAQAGCFVRKNIGVDNIIALNRQQMKTIAPVEAADYDRFRKLCRFLLTQHNAVTYGIANKQNEMLSSCVFFFSHNRAYYILVGNAPAGRNTGASHALIDAFIKDHAGEDLLLDFEGSDIESLAHFYSGFGAIQERYPVIRWNRLPWWVKWMKK